MKRITTLAGLLATSAVVPGLAQAALAQTAPPDNGAIPVGSASAAPQAEASQTADAAVEPQDVVVTGSRTVTNGNSSPTPVTVVSTETLTNVRPTSLTESVNVLPVFSGSRGQVSNPSATGGVGGGNGTAAQLNLRNIGGTRNLVLLDGRRVPPTSNTNIVDADVIPQLLIERVDVVTGGVSAVYGSDAISGVVNFVTNKNFNGIRAQAQAGISKYGDAGQRDIAIAVGTKIGDRGHFEASYEFRDDDGVLRRSLRPWYVRPVVVGNGTTLPYQLISIGTLSAQPFGGRITCGAACTLNGQYFASNGVLSPFVNGTTYTGATTQSGGAGGYLDNSLKASQRMHQLFGRFDFDVTDGIHFFLVGGANFKRNQFFGDDINLQNVTLSRANAFLAPAYQALLPNPTFTQSQIFNQAERSGAIPKTSQYFGTAGVDGKVGSVDWNVAYTYGYAKLDTLLLNNVNNQRLSAALDPVNVNGVPTCYAATQAATAVAYADCRPLNLFGPSAADPAAISYILTNSRYVAITKQDDVVADIAGSPFSTWAGDVRVALSGEYRNQSFRSTSDATPSQFADCTNLRYNCVSAGARTFLYRATLPGTPTISQNVWEVAGEANVPLIKDVPLIQSFDVNGAVRYTKYNTVGSYWTWKGGADWHVTDDLRFRGTISRDIRAPTLNDLFAPVSVVVGSYLDLLTNVTALTPGNNLPNPDLTAEIGHTKTVGIVYKPHYVPGLSLAVDYYTIRIEDAITTVQGFQAPIQTGCYQQKVQLYCDLIIRDAGTNAVTAYVIRPINLAEVQTSGVDFEANYSGRLLGRALTLRVLAAYQPHIYYRQPSVPTIDQGGVAFGTTGITASPKWRATGILGYQATDDFRFDLLYRWRDRLKLSGDPTITFLNGQDSIRPYGQASLNLAWQTDQTRLGKAEFFLNIQNLFDADPPAANMPGSATTPGAFGGFAVGDDPIGRFYTAGVRLKL